MSVDFGGGIRTGFKLGKRWTCNSPLAGVNGREGLGDGGVI